MYSGTKFYFIQHRGATEYTELCILQIYNSVRGVEKGLYSPRK